MKIEVSPSAGFCPGVKKAVETAARLNSARQIHFGPIVHNEEVVREFQERGVRIVEDLAYIEPGSTVVIRAHGISPKIRRALEGRAVDLVDCTCPFVDRIHQLAKEARARGDGVLIIGNPHHPEIIGILGEVDGEAVVLNDPSTAEETLDRELSAGAEERIYSVLLQTTLDAEQKEKILEIIRKKIAKVNIFDTICNTTIVRQSEARQLAEKSDIVLVLGSATSANTMKLYDIASEICREVYLIQRPD